MSISFRNKVTVYVVSPIIRDDGDTIIIGYENLREITLQLVPTINSIDATVYGSKVGNVIKFYDNKPLDMNVEGNEGLYLEKPIADDNGNYQNPTYITTPITNFRNKYLFDAEKQIR